MKFTKTAVAVAIAGIAAAPMIASAETTLSGVVEINVNGYAGDVNDVDIGDAGDPTVGTGDVLFGIVAEHETDSGLTGYGSLRVDMDRLSNAGTTVVANGPGEDDDQKLGSAGTADSVYTGIKGGFGDVRIGEIPLSIEYAQMANDIYDIGSEVNGGLSYTGTFGPVGLIASFSPENNSEQLGLGAKFAIGGFSIGLGGEQRGPNDDMNAAAGAAFTVAGASVAVHYALMEADDAIDGSDSEIIAAQVGYGFGGVSAKVTYTVKSGENAGSEDATAIRLDLGYAMGGGLALSTRVTNFDNNLDDGDVADGTEWRVQLAKSF